MRNTINKLGEKYVNVKAVGSPEWFEQGGFWYVIQEVEVEVAD